MGSLYHSQHELVFVFKHGRSGHRNNVQLGQYGRNRSNVWRYPGANSFARGGQEGNLLALHPTVKISARATRPTPPARSPGWRAWRSVLIHTHERANCVRTVLKSRADLLGKRRNSLAVTGLYAPIQLQLVAEFAREHVTWKCLTDCWAPGPFAWIKFSPTGDSAWLTARATLMIERETAANASSLMSKSVG
jgi:hypothetical protein